MTDSVIELATSNAVATCPTTFVADVEITGKIDVVDQSLAQAAKDNSEEHDRGNVESDPEAPELQYQQNFQMTKDEKHAKQVELDSRSIFVSSIAPETTAESLEDHFENVGNINRITILYNKKTGEPKGYAYIEFESIDSVGKALELSGTAFNGNTISVAKKRTNLPGFNRPFNFHHSHHVPNGANGNAYYRQPQRHRLQNQHFYYGNQWQNGFTHPHWNFAPYGAYVPYKNVNFYAAYQFHQAHPQQALQHTINRPIPRSPRDNFKGQYRGKHGSNKRGGFTGTANGRKSKNIVDENDSQQEGLQEEHSDTQSQEEVISPSAEGPKEG